MKCIKSIIKYHTRGRKEQIDKDMETFEHRMCELENSSWGDKEYVEVKEKLNDLYHSRESMLRQKSRQLLIQKGDDNTKFFHRAIQKRRSSNNIIKLLWNKNWIDDPGQIKEAFYEYYSDFFRDKHLELLSLGSMHLNKLSEHGRLNLIEDFSINEIEAALNSLAEDKAPGPDGFNIKCIKFFWPVLRSKVQKFISTLDRKPLCLKESIPLL